MHFKHMLPELSIRNRLLLLNVMICVSFLLITGVVFFSLAVIRDMTTEMTDSDVGKVVSNAQTARELSTLFAGIDLLNLTFYGRDDDLKLEAGRLVGIAKHIVESTTDPQLKKALLALSDRLESFLSRCALVNTALHRRESIDRKTHADLTKLDAIISKLLIKLTLEGKDTAFVEQLLALSAGYRESLLRIGRLSGQPGPEHYPKPPEEKIPPVIPVIDHLILRLHTLTASIPEVSKSGMIILSDLQKYKKAVLGYHSEMVKLSSRLKDLNHYRALAMTIMENIDNDIYKTTRLVSDNIGKIISSTGTVVLLLSMIVIIALIFTTAYLIRSTINIPMRSIQKGIESFGKGDFDRKIRLGRKDEWDLIEKTLNNMATELLKSYTTLKESEKKYRILVENANDLIFVVQDEVIKFPNTKTEDVLGYHKDELIKIPFTNLIHPEDMAMVLHRHRKRLAGEDPPSIYSFRVINKAGKRLWIQLNTVFIDWEGRPATLNFLRDITQQRKLETQLQKARKMETMGLMAGGIAHDLNNILSGIVSYPELLLRELPANSPLRKPVENIKASGIKASEVVADLLTIARGVVTGKDVLNLNTTVEEYLNSAEHKKLEETYSFVTFKARLDSGLLNVNGSRTHLGKTLMNLVRNASEAIEEVGTVTISTANRYLDEPPKGYEDVPTGEYAVMTVSDDGPGISPRDLERIFEPFYTKKVMDRAGTGLGLTVVWNTVRDLNGHINVESSQKGTVFELYFPATREEVTAGREEVPLEDYLGNGEKILVVDDEENQRQIACVMLTQLGYTTEAVSSGEDAIEYVKKHPVDIIVLDMVMPKGINGRETYERIVQVRPGQKAIIASGYAKTKEVDTAQESGAGKYIKKPYTLETIGIAVKEELEKQ